MTQAELQSHKESRRSSPCGPPSPLEGWASAWRLRTRRRVASASEGGRHRYRHQMKSADRRRQGFTLIELILVMVVVFTLATVVVPRFSDFFPSLQVRKTTE